MRGLVRSVALAVAMSFRQFVVLGRVPGYDWQRTAKVCHPANPGGCHQLKTLQHRAGHLGGALLGAPVPAGSHLERPKGQGGCAVMGYAFAPLGSRQPFVSRQQVVHVLVPISGSDVMEKEEKLDSRCIVSPGCSLRSRGPLRTEDRVSLGTNSQQPRAPRRRHRSYCNLCCKRLFLYRAHCPYDDLYPNQPGHRGNLLCMADWLCLRGIAGTECAILPIQEITTYSRCSECELTSAHGAPVSASRKSFKTISQRGETTNRTPTSYHSCRGSYFRSSSLLTVRIRLADTFEAHQIRLALSLRGFAGTECDILQRVVLAHGFPL